MSFIELDHVLKRYDTKITVNHLSLTIEKGEVFGLLGPNGAGKSTTIHMLTGLLPYDQGDIRIGGLSVKKSTLDIKRQIGLVPQELAIYETLTARENVTFFGRLYGLSGKLLRERVDEALDFVGLRDRAGDKPASYSGGMKRRLNIACAIMHHPELIIMDEPTVGIDPQSRNHILESIKKLNEMGSTVIYTSHYMEEVEAISTRVGIMDHGQLIACGTKEELLDQIGRDETLFMATQDMKERALEELQQHAHIRSVQFRENQLELLLRPSDTVLQDILFILSSHEVKITSFQRVEPNLETLFLSLTGRSLRD
ncbi:export ABC transporter ATP-binding protein [Paenibacillus selenitireducens]|uniref:Export ABC transporter ATP-binding protein n=1 Tax=Paenibacillus selenitireducens TaxID=1324314 RepID=A0A1T2XFC1_9BACL|nr:ABC transporter ATP-binding protein [Paenibacillus selenitireducens]OPA78528.1 export ABC transporter ATP-binding protein [Paenibacillus selenitireducens]